MGTALHKPLEVRLAELRVWVKGLERHVDAQVERAQNKPMVRNAFIFSFGATLGIPFNINELGITRDDWYAIIIVAVDRVKRDFRRANPRVYIEPSFGVSFTMASKAP